MSNSVKKIAFISAGYLPLPSVKGGAVETLIDTLLASSKISEKYQIDVYSIYDKEAIDVAKNQDKINYIYIKSSFIFVKAFRYLINKYTKKYIGNDYITKLIKKYRKKLLNYDYVIVENKPEYGLILRKFVKGKLIFHSHNDFLNSDTKHANQILASYDKIFALSKFICNRIREINEKDGEEKVRLLYNGIDIEKFKNTNSNEVKLLKKSFKISNDDIVILYTGRLVKEKGVKELIQSFNKINNDKFKLVIIGSIKSGVNKTNKFISELNDLSKNNNNIIFTGYVNYDKIPLYYAIADVGVIPSIWEEPFALTVIEHLASGHPVIITDSGAMPELVNDKVARIVDRNKDFIKNLSNAIVKVEKSTSNIKESCILQAQRFNKNNYINRFDELLSVEEEDAY